MKTSGSTESKIRPGKGGVGVAGSKVGRSGSKLDENELDRGEVDGGEVDEEVGEKGQKTSKSKNTIGSLDFLTPRAKLAFTKLRQAFLKAPILYHLDPECHIWIKTDVSGYAISGVISQLTLDDLGRWHLVIFFFRKMIPAETRYETHDDKFLAIVETFKTWGHYLESFQHEVLMLTDHNNLGQFIDTKSLSSRQVRWAQELSCYYFQIDYCQGKANGAVNALFQYPQRSGEEEKTLRAENIKILHYLQSVLTNTSLSGLTFSKPNFYKPNLSPLY